MLYAAYKENVSVAAKVIEATLRRAATTVEAVPDTPASSAPAIRRVTLHEQIVTRLRDSILDGTLPAGSHIIETVIGAELGVSRTPLREAFKTLAGEGLIEFTPGRGAFVPAISADHTRDILEVLTGIEGVAGRLATIRATDGEIAEVRHMQNAMIDHFKRRDRLGYYKINLDIHRQIVELSHNAELIALHRQYATRVQRLRFNGSSTLEMWKAAIGEHEAMIAALERRDAAALEKVLREHLGLIWQRLRTLLVETDRS